MGVGLYILQITSGLHYRAEGKADKIVSKQKLLSMIAASFVKVLAAVPWCSCVCGAHVCLRAHSGELQRDRCVLRYIFFILYFFFIFSQLRY